MSKRRHTDPNRKVESWKDAIYEEIKNLSGKDLDQYFKKVADKTLRSHKLVRCFKIEARGYKRGGRGVV